MIAMFERTRPEGGLYARIAELSGRGFRNPVLLSRVEHDARVLCRALGYDLNTVEFAVENGVPYAIDFMNPAPDAELRSVGPDNFKWIVDAVATLAVRKAQAPREPMPYRWGKLV